MADKYEIEIGENGRPTGPLPDAVQTFFQKEIDAAVARVAKKAASSSPVDLERLKALEEENQSFKRVEAERLQDYQKAREMLEQQHTKKLQEVSTALDAERTRARTLAQRTLREQIRAAALTAGAHPEFLDDFADLVVTRSAIDFDAAQDYAPVVKQDTGVAPLDVAAHVKAMLDARPNFRVAPPPGGGARGGAYVHTQATPATAAEARFEAARERVQKHGDQSASAVAELFDATQALNRARRS